MNWLKQHHKSIIIAAIVTGVLSVAFFFSEQPVNDVFDDQKAISAVSETTIIPSPSVEPSIHPNVSSDIASSIEEFVSVSEITNPASLAESSLSVYTESETSKPSRAAETQKEDVSQLELYPDEFSTEELPIVGTESDFLERSEIPVQSSAPTISSPSEEIPENCCTLSVFCTTAVNNSSLSASVKAVLPSDGIILQGTSVKFEEGESVFDITKRVCMEQRIPFEFSITPVYNTAYVEGIFNLYQFDCGSASGWVYSVNGIFPSYGCSEYKLKDGDRIEWHYTCNLGKDVGDNG